MGCSSAGRQLSLHLDGRLPLDQQARLEEHLAGCADCRAELGALQQARRVMAAPGPAAPPPGLAARAARAAIAAGRPESVTGFVDLLLGWKWAAAGAVGFATVALVLVTLMGGLLPAVGQGGAADPVASLASAEAAGLARSAMVSQVLAEEDE